MTVTTTPYILLIAVEYSGPGYVTWVPGSATWVCYSQLSTLGQLLIDKYNAQHASHVLREFVTLPPFYLRSFQLRPKINLCRVLVESTIVVVAGSMDYSSSVDEVVMSQDVG